MTLDNQSAPNFNLQTRNSTIVDFLLMEASTKDGYGNDRVSGWIKSQLISDEQRLLSDQIQLGIRWLLLPVAILLTLCNLVIFLQPSMRSSASSYVVALSIAQIVNLVLYLVLHIMAKIIPNAIDSQGYWIFSVYFMAFITAIARRGSYVVMCILSLERLYAVLRPFHVKTFLLSRRPVLLTVIVYVLAALLHVYVPVKTYVASVQLGPRIVYRPLPTAFYLQHRKVNDAFSLLAKVSLIYLPLFLLLILTVLTVWGLRRHRLSTSHLTSSTDDDIRHQRERQMTFTIFTATVAYVVLSLPQAFHFVLSTVFVQYRYSGELSNLYQVNNWLVGNLTIFSCVIDFVCFLSTSSKYRNTLCHLMGWRGKASFTNRNTKDVSNTETTETAWPESRR